MCTLFKASLLQFKQLQSSEREKERLREQLTNKEAELTRAEETIWREQQWIQEMKEQTLFFNLQKLQQQMQSSGREKMYRQELMRKEAELPRAEETISREQQQIQQQVSDCIWHYM